MCLELFLCGSFRVVAPKRYREYLWNCETDRKIYFGIFGEVFEGLGEFFFKKFPKIRALLTSFSRSHFLRVR